MKLFKKIFLLSVLILSIKISNAADTTLAPLRVAVLTPLYLDSAFNGYEYQLSNINIPQFFLSGLDFYNGVMMAIDSLQKQNANIEVWIYDTHKQGQTIQQLTNEMQTMNFSLVIASLSSSSEQQAVSDYSSRNSVPVISATFPTDVYLNYNPFFIMVNPTWKTHVDAIFNYLSNNYRNRTIVYLTRKGFLEQKISEEFQSLNTNHAINFSTVVLDDDFTDNDLLSHLDSTKQNVILCGSLYENFGASIIKTLNDNGETYSSVVMGMPTWNGMNATLGNSSKNIQIVISTSYKYSVKDTLLQQLADDYKAVYNSRPSDMVYKGYETMYHFTNLLLVYHDNLINHISDSAFKVANDYNFQPIRLSKTSFVPDYLENKKMYFIKIADGQVQSIN